MRWREGPRSENIEDRRGAGGPVVAGGVGLPGLLLALAVALLGGDPTVILQQLSQGQPDSAVVIGSPRERSPQQEQLADFVSVVLADTEDTWTESPGAPRPT